MSEPLGIADPALLEESVEDLYENAPCGYVSALPDGKPRQDQPDLPGLDRLPAGGLGRQVLTNLLGNAIKFTASGLVAVMLRVRESVPEAVAIEFQVLDTGIGIALDQLAHIFDDFAQANADIGPRYGGTGLGLAISKSWSSCTAGRSWSTASPDGERRSRSRCG